MLRTLAQGRPAIIRGTPLSAGANYSAGRGAARDERSPLGDDDAHPGLTRSAGGHGLVRGCQSAPPGGTLRPSTSWPPRRIDMPTTDVSDELMSAGSWYPWPVWVTLGWGVGLVFNAWDVYVRRPVSEADLRHEMDRLAHLR
jgi:hypothetical protein